MKGMLSRYCGSSTNLVVVLTLGLSLLADAKSCQGFTTSLNLSSCSSHGDNLFGCNIDHCYLTLTPIMTLILTTDKDKDDDNDREGIVCVFLLF